MNKRIWEALKRDFPWYKDISIKEARFSEPQGWSVTFLAIHPGGGEITTTFLTTSAWLEAEAFEEPPIRKNLAFKPGSFEFDEVPF